MTAIALTIAGSDSSGGAGIQADLKTFSALEVYGASVITALTAQNTLGVEAVQVVPPDFVLAQVRAVARDLKVGAVKIGMLATRGVIEAVAEGLDDFPGVPVVLDPVMVSESGANLLAVEAREALVTRILPRATVTTPNIPEARAITGLAEAGQPELAEVIVGLGVKAAVVTGGHSDEYVDFFFDGERGVEITGEVHPGRSAHGSGCTHSSALAAGLALGLGPLEAARKARELASRAVAGSLDGIGSGPGPVNALGL